MWFENDRKGKDPTIILISFILKKGASKKKQEY
jgi:hypothetical protein